MIIFGWPLNWNSEYLTKDAISVSICHICIRLPCCVVYRTRSNVLSQRVTSSDTAALEVANKFSIVESALRASSWLTSAKLTIVM